MYDFFISYSRFDAEYARVLWKYLQMLGIPVWFAESKILIQARKRWKDQEKLKKELIEAIRKSRHCLLLLSKNSVESDWVMKVEVPPFKCREQKENKQIIVPIRVGEENGQSNTWMPNEYLGKNLLEFRKPREEDVEKLVTLLMKRLGYEYLLDYPFLPPRSFEIDEHIVTITTDKRQFRVALDIGTEWTPARQTSKDMFLFTNAETNILLNLIVGVMPAEFESIGTASDVEKANYFAEIFVYQKESYIKRFVRNAFERPKDLSAISVKDFINLMYYPLVNLIVHREVLGSHLFNALNKPHFAFTYKTKFLFDELISRKYAIVTKPPGSDRHFEFVFTASYRGSYRDFLSRIGRVDDIVLSFRFMEDLKPKTT